ncbi:MAG: hypothetical protein H8E41_12315 [Desulfobulbaceae bacterium]|uniref:Rhodanese domain-containing protein n=1 Tax=Candidatus Desulfobia pelagia TaxID=2841692 RepID=A0A8J6TH11_9BACT|nr:hypothetical protein [Candidatus Desulfobia pelagia]
MAVAIKKMGFTNINIYNGGLRDWIDSGLPVESIDPLPAYNGTFISAAELREKIAETDAGGCVDKAGNPLLTIIDFRSSLIVSEKKGGDKYRIQTNCRTITTVLDDFIDNPTLINSVPKTGMVVTICETGNRDLYLMRYLSKFGYSNIKGLQFGMRAWLKADYPVEKIATTPLQ